MLDDEINQIISGRKKKVEELRKKGINPYSNDFRVSNTLKEIISTRGKETAEELEKNKLIYYVAGRIVAINDFGKAAFVRLRDYSGQIQVFLRKDSLSNEKFEFFKKYIDIGDFIGVKGYLFRTKTNELTILAEEFSLITKTIRPLPEKFHGLKDLELRHRQRYLDLIVNQEVKEIFQKRRKIIQYIRKFLDERDFLEVETPMMQSLYGGANAKPFITHHNALNIDLYLRIAPELYLKRLVVGGFERVYEINRNFRNEGISSKHNPEFTMLEFYQSYATYEDFINLTEELMEGLVLEVCGKYEIEYGEKIINFKPPYKRMNLKDAIAYFGNICVESLEDREGILEIIKNKSLNINPKLSYGKLIMELFEKLVEPNLISPTFILNFPTEISPLSRKNDRDQKIVDRFEFIAGGIEIANAFSELNDPFDQRERFEMQIKEKEKGDEEAHLMDEDFIKALEYGMPPAAGEGIGIDRLVMILTNQTNIREVILFPLLRPE